MREGEWFSPDRHWELSGRALALSDEKCSTLQWPQPALRGLARYSSHKPPSGHKSIWLNTTFSAHLLRDNLFCCAALFRGNAKMLPHMWRLQNPVAFVNKIGLRIELCGTPLPEVQDGYLYITFDSLLKHVFCSILPVSVSDDKHYE